MNQNVTESGVPAEGNRYISPMTLVSGMSQLRIKFHSGYRKVHQSVNIGIAPLRK
jgi:hypothetical protein